MADSHIQQCIEWLNWYSQQYGAPQNDPATVVRLIRATADYLNWMKSVNYSLDAQNLHRIAEDDGEARLLGDAAALRVRVDEHDADSGVVIVVDRHNDGADISKSVVPGVAGRAGDIVDSVAGPVVIDIVVNGGDRHRLRDVPGGVIEG